MLFQSAIFFWVVCSWQITSYINVFANYHLISCQKPKSSVDKEPYQYLVIKKQQHYENIYTMSPGQMANNHGRRLQSIFDAVPAFFFYYNKFWAGSQLSVYST